MPAPDGDGRKPRSLRFALNLLWSLWGVVTLAALSFFLLPYLVRHLGLEGYALYALMGTLAGNLTLLSLGAGNATVKFVAELIGRGDGLGLRRALRASLFFHGGAVLLGAAAVFLSRGWLAAVFFKVSPAARGDASFILACAAAGAVFFSLTQFAVCIFHGQQNFGLANVVQVLQTVCVLGGSAVLLRLGFGLRALGVLYAAANLALCSVFLFLARRSLPALPEDPARERPGDVGTFARYSVQAFMSQLAWSVTFQWDKLLIGFLLPLSQLTYYMIPSSILQRLWVLPQSVTFSVFPMLSEMSGQGDVAALRRAYRQCSQLVLWLMIPGFVVLMLLAPQILTLWVGADFSEHGVWPLRFMAVGYFFYLLASMPSTAAYGLGKPIYNVAWLSVQGALCVIGWACLIPRHGIAGAALAFALAQAATDLPYVAVVSGRLFGMSFGEYVEGVLWRPVAAGAVLALALWPVRPHVDGWAALLVICPAAAACYYALGFWLLDEPERETLRRLWSAALAKRALKQG